MSEHSRQGVIHISPAIIREALQLPYDTVITGAEWEHSYVDGQLLLYVQHADLPESIEGAKIPAVTPTVKTIFSWE